MILITLGTQDKEFKRLLEEVDRLIEKKIIKDKVVVQAGYTKYKSDNMEIFDYVSQEELDKLIKESNLVITHAGVGSIFSALKMDKKVIAVPRLSKYGEHTNDHQLEIIKELDEKSMIIPTYDVSELEQAIKKVSKFKVIKYESNNDNMVKLIDKYIENNEKRTIRELFKKYREIIMYLIFGVLTTVISLIVYYLLVYTVLNPDNAIELQVANIISWIAGVSFAYFTNRSFVFESKTKNKIKEAANFVSSRIITLIMDMLVMFVGVTLLNGSDKIIKVISQILVIVSNYLFSKLFVFKKEK